MELAKSATKITKTGAISIKKQKSGSATILQKTDIFKCKSKICNRSFNKLYRPVHLVNCVEVITDK